MQLLRRLKNCNVSYDKKEKLTIASLFLFTSYEKYDIIEKRKVRNKVERKC